MPSAPYPDNLFSIAKKELLIQMLDSLSDEITRNQSPDLIDEKIASMSMQSCRKGQHETVGAGSRCADR